MRPQLPCTFVAALLYTLVSLVAALANSNDLLEPLFNRDFPRLKVESHQLDSPGKMDGVSSSALVELISGFVIAEDPRGSD